jgi:hypothetical protein
MTTMGASEGVEDVEQRWHGRGAKGCGGCEFVRHLSAWTFTAWHGHATEVLPHVSSRFKVRATLKEGTTLNSCMIDRAARHPFDLVICNGQRSATGHNNYKWIPSVTWLYIYEVLVSYL